MDKIKLKIINTNFLKIVFVVFTLLILSFLFLVPSSFAAVMSSENYQVGTNIIGMGAFGAQSSANYSAEYPWQNITPAVTTPPTTPTASSGGGGASTPTHIDVFNLVLTLTKDQSGTLSYALPSRLGINIEVPSKIIPKGITLIVKVEKKSTANQYLIPPASDLIGDVFWNISAVDSDGAVVTNFEKQITITLQVPNLLPGVKDLGVYFLGENLSKWILVPGATFTNNTAIFSINHPARFAIFRRGGKEDALKVVLPTKSTRPTFKTRNVEQSFDINLELNNMMLSASADLVARVIFANFGIAPTPVDLTFIIRDEQGNVVYRDNGKSVDVVVEIKNIFTKTFKDLNLPSGTYTLVLKTLHNVNISGEFQQEFKIVAKKAYVVLWQLLLISIGVLIIFWFLFFVYRRRKKSKGARVQYK